MIVRSFGSFALVCFAFTILGCGGTVDPNRPKTYPVTGQVTYNGSPVEEAVVMFAPSGSGGRGSVGRTDAAGNFTLTTFDSGDGALPGTYQVSITKRTVEEVPEGARTGPGGEPITSVETQHLPQRYGNVSTSGLTAEVAEGGENVFTFALTN